MTPDGMADRRHDNWPVFEKLAVTEEQIEEHNLPTRPTKTGSTHAKDWNGSESVELDAMPEEVLQGLVRDAIMQHIDIAAFKKIKEVEASETRDADDVRKEAERKTSMIDLKIVTIPPILRTQRYVVTKIVINDKGSPTKPPTSVVTGKLHDCWKFTPDALVTIEESYRVRE